MLALVLPAFESITLLSAIVKYRAAVLANKYRPGSYRNANFALYLSLDDVDFESGGTIVSS